jgi:hypothetical protein
VRIRNRIGKHKPKYGFIKVGFKGFEDLYAVPFHDTKKISAKFKFLNGLKSDSWRCLNYVFYLWNEELKGILHWIRPRIKLGPPIISFGYPESETKWYKYKCYNCREYFNSTESLPEETKEYALCAVCNWQLITEKHEETV